MHKGIITTFMTALVILGSVTQVKADVNVNANVNSRASHVHEYLSLEYYGEDYENIYTHDVLVGINPITGVKEYGSCQIIEQHEIYRFRCACGAWQSISTGGYRTKVIRDHTICNNEEYWQ